MCQHYRLGEAGGTGGILDIDDVITIKRCGQLLQRLLGKCLRGQDQVLPRGKSGCGRYRIFGVGGIKQENTGKIRKGLCIDYWPGIHYFGDEFQQHRDIIATAKTRDYKQSL